jgi:hypothetical protein
MSKILSKTKDFQYKIKHGFWANVKENKVKSDKCPTPSMLHCRDRLLGMFRNSSWSRCIWSSWPQRRQYRGTCHQKTHLLACAGLDQHWRRLICYQIPNTFSKAVLTVSEKKRSSLAFRSCLSTGPHVSQTNLRNSKTSVTGTSCWGRVSSVRISVMAHNFNKASIELYHWTLKVFRHRKTGCKSWRIYYANIKLRSILLI